MNKTFVFTVIHGIVIRVISFILPEAKAEGNINDITRVNGI